MDISHFGQTLKRFRLYKGLTVKSLAVAAGLSPSYVSRLENSGRNPARATVLKLASALGFMEGDSRYDELMESAGYTGTDEREILARPKTVIFSCMELHLLNHLFRKVDRKSQVDLRLALRLLADGLSTRIRENQVTGG